MGGGNIPCGYEVIWPLHSSVPTKKYFFHEKNGTRDACTRSGTLGGPRGDTGSGTRDGIRGGSMVCIRSCTRGGTRRCTGRGTGGVNRGGT